MLINVDNIYKIKNGQIVGIRKERKCFVAFYIGYHGKEIVYEIKDDGKAMYHVMSDIGFNIIAVAD